MPPARRRTRPEWPPAEPEALQARRHWKRPRKKSWIQPPAPPVPGSWVEGAVKERSLRDPGEPPLL